MPIAISESFTLAGPEAVLFLVLRMAILSNYPCQFSLGMVFLHLTVLGVVAYKQLQYLGLQVRCSILKQFLVLWNDCACCTGRHA